MRRFTPQLIMVAAGLVAFPVLAQTTSGPQPGPFMSPQQEPYGGPGPIDQAPNSQSSPDREAAERQVERDVRQWGERIEALAARPEAEQDEMRELRRRHQAVVMQYQNLVQAEGSAWDTARGQLLQAEERLATAYRRAGGQVAEGQ